MVVERMKEEWVSCDGNRVLWESEWRRREWCEVGVVSKEMFVVYIFFWFVLVVGCFIYIFIFYFVIMLGL